MPTSEYLETTTLPAEEESVINESSAAADAETETFAETLTESEGVWKSDTMDLSDALGVSVVGFGIVFAVLGFLAIFVFSMGKVFEAIGKKSEKKEEATAAEAEQTSAASAGYPLPDNQSIGDLTLINTTEEEAAVIMAITSNKSGIPLNRLKFNSIKLLEDDKK